MKKYFSLLAILFLLAACDNPHSQVLPSKIDGNEDKIKAMMEGLSDEEKALLVKRLIANTFSEKFRGESVITPGTTVGEAINAQKKIEDANKLEEAKQEALKKEYLKQKQEMKQQFDAAIDVSLVDKKYYKEGFEEAIALKIAFKNKTAKDISGIKGITIFKDIFGDTIKEVRLSSDDPIKAGKTFIYKGGLDYNQFKNEDKKLAFTELEKIKFEFQPLVILFEDGSKLELKDNLEE